MKRLISAVLLSAAVVVPTMAKNAKTLGNGYPFTQVPFTSVKISQNTFWGARLKAAREVTVPLAFSKCESEQRNTKTARPCITTRPGFQLCVSVYVKQKSHSYRKASAGSNRTIW